MVDVSHADPPIVDRFPGEEIRRLIGAAERCLDGATTIVGQEADPKDYATAAAVASARAAVAQVYATQRQTDEIIAASEMLAKALDDVRRAVEAGVVSLATHRYETRPLWRVIREAVVLRWRSWRR